jgi:hypothetical protein
MKVKELIKKLQELDQDRIVVSSDEEGNHFSPLDSNLCEGNYYDEDREFGLDKLTKEDIEAGFSEEDIVNGKKAVCLYPIY